MRAPRRGADAGGSAAVFLPRPTLAPVFSPLSPRPRPLTPPCAPLPFLPLSPLPSPPPPSPSPPTALDRLKRYGLAGVLAYGLFNTVYYAGAFLAAWAARGAAVKGAGLQAGAREAAAVLAAVWVGSQVTKALRAGLALALAPLVDSAIHRAALRTGARRKAIFAAAVLVCAVCGLGVMAGAVIVNA